MVLTTEAGIPRKRAGRSPTLDALKGLLVLVMVLYHWLNYFVTSEGSVYKYLRFVTPSFIFITGFLITNQYLMKYHIGEPRLHRRLLMRGLKLVAVFTVLNLGALLVVQEYYNAATLGIERFLANAPSIYLSGNGRYAAFEVLIPIGYLLAASSMLLWGCKLHKSFLLAIWLVSVGGVYVLKWSRMESANAELLTMGLLGMVVGGFTLEAIDRVGRLAGAWIGAYAIYAIALSIYDVIYELQVVGLILNLMLLYMAAKGLGETSTIARAVILIGQYSLLAYVAQVAILQVLARAMRPLDSGPSTYVLSLGAALALTCLSVEVTDRVRSQSTLMDRLYRLVFA